MAFQTARTLRFGDCDPSGIAYFPAYFDILVGVVEEFFASLGAPWPTLIGKRRIGTPTAKLDVTFTAPAFHGDRLDFTVMVGAVGRSSLELATAVEVAGRRVWSARQVLVATSLETHRSCAWPDQIRSALVDHLEVRNAHDPAA
jgi:4-hydroxybenzoyl-CoA thioesterase